MGLAEIFFCFDERSVSFYSNIVDDEQKKVFTKSSDLFEWLKTVCEHGYHFISF